MTENQRIIEEIKKDPITRTTMVSDFFRAVFTDVEDRWHFLLTTDDGKLSLETSSSHDQAQFPGRSFLLQRRSGVLTREGPVPEAVWDTMYKGYQQKLVAAIMEVLYLGGLSPQSLRLKPIRIAQKPKGQRGRGLGNQWR
jgi:hypothetical protein